jgi:hypothetical protein
MRQARFGVSVAGLILEDLLIEHNIKSRNVNAMIADLHSGLNFLYDAPDKQIYESMWISWRQCFVRRARKLGLPQIIETHLLTTIVGLCKQKRREYMINRGGLGKNKKDQLIEEYKIHYNRFVEKANEV